MSSVPLPELLDASDGRRTKIAMEFALDSRQLLLAAPAADQRMLSAAALHLADEEPNRAVALLLGCALEASCRDDLPQVALAIGAAVHQLQAITRSQLEGVTP